MSVAKPASRTFEVPVKFWQGGARLFYDETKRDHIIFAGVGYGKSWAGIRWARRRMLRNFGSRSKKGAIIAPTHKHLKFHHVPLFKDALREIGYFEGVHYTVDQQHNILSFTKKSGIQYQVFFVSMENWKALVAWEFDWLWWDEPGFGSEELKMFVDQRVNRLKDTPLGQTLYTGVVQIVNWYYKRFGVGAQFEIGDTYNLPDWVEQIAPGYGGRELVRFRESDRILCLHGSTFENPEIGLDYHVQQYESYGYLESKYRGQVLGEAIAINTNAVYETFDPGASVGDYPVDFMGETMVLHLCMDFNVGNMSGAVVQSYQGSEYVVWENPRTCHITADVCKAFIEAFPPEKFGNRHVYIYGDASGFNDYPTARTIDGSYSIAQDSLKGKYAKVIVKARRDTIPQETRVMSTQKYHANSAAKRPFGLYVDRKCRKLVDSWNTTSWDPKSGDIKKGGDNDTTHMAEAVDYYMVVAHPPLNLKNSVSSLSR